MLHFLKKNILQDDELYDKMSALVPEIKEIAQYKTHTKTPICVIGIDKTRKISEVYELLKPLKPHTKLLVFVDAASNDVHNPYMLVWRVVNNMDAQRDVYLNEEFIGINGTNKGELEDYKREWPGDTDCDPDVIKSLMDRGLLTVNEEFLKHYYV